MIKAAIHALNEIEAMSGLKEKQERVADESDNQAFKSMLVMAYSPFMRFQVSKIPQSWYGYDSDEYDEEKSFQEFEELTQRLTSREITGKAASDAIKAYFMTIPERYAFWYRRVLQKDLRLGIKDTSINKAIPNLIPVYAVMLANKITPEEFLTRDKKAMGKLPFKCAIQRKIDGYRMNLRKEVGGITMVSRNGLPIPGNYPGIRKDAMRVLPDGYVYDGEVVDPALFDWIAENEKRGGVTAQDRELFAKSISSRAKKDENKVGVFCLFDAVPVEEWDAQSQTAPYRERMIFLNQIPDTEFIRKVPVDFSDVTAAFLQEIWQWFETYNRAGWEGVMIKDADAPYQWKRSNALLKMKRMDTADLTVLRVEEGTGRNKGRLGAIIVDFNGNEVHVGSGFSDAQREQFYLFPNLIVGQTVEISYQAVTKNNKTKQESLSFPVFKGIRNDK